MALPPWKKVLVVDLGFLGDTIHSIPALRALAQSGAQVDVVTTTVGGETLALVPEIHQIWKIHLQKPSPPFWKSFSQLRSLRREKYDAAITRTPWANTEGGRNRSCGTRFRAAIGVSAQAGLER